MAGQFSLERQWLIPKSVDGLIDASCVKQYETDFRYWRQDFQRCMDKIARMCLS